jgi:hypothetical protein
MRRLPVSCLAILSLAVLIHLDWHLGRPHHMRLSMEWGGHWLLAIPAFTLTGWYLAARFPDRLWAASALNLLGSAVAAQVLEPLAENLSDGRVTLAMPAERWVAFAQFMSAGLMTYIATLAWLERRRTLHRGSP